MNHLRLCILPWTGMELTTRGRWILCCRMSEEQSFGLINDDPVTLFSDSHYLKNIRNTFLRGEIPPQCQCCFDEESRGGKSYRQEVNQFFSGRIDSLLADPQVRFLDVRFSNRCNLACRTCKPVASTGWAQDALMMGLAGGDSVRSALEKALKQEKKTLDLLLKNSFPLEKIQIVGGEPFLTPAVYSYIEKLHEQKRHDIFFIFSSNMSTLNCHGKNLIKLLAPFPRIRFIMSIDGFGPLNNYIRHGSTWEHIVDNIYNIKKNLPQVELKLYPTISLLNILKISELLIFFIEQEIVKMNSIQFNFLERPSYYSITNMPPNMRKYVVESFSELEKKYPELKIQLNRTIRFFESSDFQEEKLQSFF